MASPRASVLQAEDIGRHVAKLLPPDHDIRHCWVVRALQPDHEGCWRHAWGVSDILESRRLRVRRFLLRYGVARCAGGMRIFEARLGITDLSHRHVPDVLSGSNSDRAEQN